MTSTPPVACSVNPRQNFPFYSSHIREPKRPGFRHKRRIQHEWVCYLPIRGDLEVIDELPCGETQIHVPTAHIHCIPPGTPQSFAKAMEKDAAFLWWHFYGPTEKKHWQWCNHQEAIELIDAQLEANKQERWLIPIQCDVSSHLSEFHQLHQQLCDIQGQWGPNDFAAHNLIKHMMYRMHQIFCASLVEDSDESAIDSGNADARHVRRVQWLIQTQYRRFHSLADIADELDINPAYLARCCKRILNKSVGDLIVEQRVRTAQDLMRTGEYNLKEIAFLCGFSSLNYFSRRFKQVTGTTASEWRGG